MRYLYILANLCFLFIINASASCLLPSNKESDYGNNFKNLQLPYDANIVNVIYQDSNGLMWFGTKRGLINYNGFNYHQCYYGKNIPDENTIQTIVQADDNYLYAGTDNGIRKLNLHTWQFENINKALASIKAVRVLAMFDNKLWIGTRDEGLFYYDSQKGKLHKIPSNIFPHKLVYSMLLVGSRLYVGSYGGLNVYDRNNHKFSSISLTDVNATIVNSMAYDKQNNCIWLGTDGKLLQYDLQNNKISSRKQFFGSLKSITPEPLSNRLVIGTESGLQIFDITSGTTQTIEHNIHNPQSLCNNLIYNSYKDRQDNLWIATDNGVSVSRQSPLIQDIKLSDLIDSNKGNLFTCLLIGTDNDYWLGGENGLLHVTGNNSVWYSTFNNKYTLRNNNVRAIYKDHSNKIWIATDGGVAKFDDRTEQFAYCKIGNKHNNTNWTYGIQEDNRHRMWIATYMSGLIIVDKDKLESSTANHVTLTNSNFFFPKEIQSVYQLRSDKHGIIWANTNKGLLRINPSSGNYDQMNMYMDNFICDDDDIWFSDQGKIYKYEVNNNKKHKITYEVPYGSAHVVMTSAQGRIWVASIDGIAYINKKSLNVFPCDVANKHNMSAVYDKTNKRIIFGGEDGLAVLDIDKYDKSKHHKTAYISAIMCDTLKIPVTETGKHDIIRLPSFEDVTIELASYDYSSRGETFYYKWNNDKEWKRVKANDNLLTYPVMPSGRNTLRLSLTNPDIDQNAIVTVYTFSVPYPWYLSTWAWIIYICVLSGGIFFLFRMQKRKNERIFERKAKEKTMELTRMKMEFFVDVSHELKTPLSLIIAPLGKLLSETTNVKLRDTLKGIQNNALKLNSLIYKIVDDKQTEYDAEESLLRSHVELVTLIGNCISNFSPIITEKNITVEFTHDVNELWMNVDNIKMESVFTNLLSNAIKHVDNNTGMVHINLLVNGDNVIASVKDNGTGIAVSEMPMIFMKHYQCKGEKKENHGTGIGLYLVKKYVEMHQGKVDVTNDNGAIFMVSIPLTNNNIIKNDNTLDSNTTDTNNNLPCILVIDDNEEVVEFLCSALCNKYKCLKAYDGKEGLAVLESHPADLVIVDEMMPVMNGMDFVRTIKHNAKTENIPVIMLTAKDDFNTEMQSIKVGVDVFISKPFDFNKLLLQVARLIKRTQTIRQSNHIDKMIETAVTESVDMESSDELFMKELLKCIDENMDKEGYNVSMISDMMAVDQKQLYRKVKQLTGKTPVNFLRTMRLKRAAELLRQNRFTISEVMYMVGISNASYFTKCFTAEYGVTPKQYIQEHNR